MGASHAELHTEVERLRQHNAHLAAYREISEAVLGAATMEAVAATALAIMPRLFGAEGGALLLAPEPDQSPQEPWECCSPQAAREDMPQATRWGLLRAAQRDEQPLVACDAAALLAQEGLPAAPGVTNLLVVPVCLESRCLGAMILHNFASPEHLPRYAGEATALLSPVSHAIARMRLSQAYARDAGLLETIVENTRAHLAYLDRDMRFVRANSTYVEGCGHAWAELMGRNHFEFFPNVENQAIFERVRDTGEPVEYIEKPFEYIDQPERGVTYWDWTLTPVKNEQGSVQGLVLSLTDVTERVRTRERMLAAERERARMAETLAAEVNHRVKNNLALVAGLLQMQLEGQREVEPAALGIREAIARICTIAAVHDQLSETQSESVELSEVMRRIAGIVRDALSRGDVEIAVRADPVFYPAKIATTICVVANELITNAIKYGAPGPRGRLEIRVSIALRDRKLHLSVWNSGNPVPCDFEPSRQTTMGLRLVHDMAANQYRGSFTVRPHDGGTMADVVLDDDRLRRER